MRISDWSSDVCSSDLRTRRSAAVPSAEAIQQHEHHQPFQQRLIQLRRMTGKTIERAAGMQAAQLRHGIDRQLRDVGKQHPVRTAGWLAPQFAADVIDDAAKAKARWDQRSDTIEG